MSETTTGVRLRVIGTIIGGERTLPVMLPGVTVTLTESPTEKPSTVTTPIVGKTDSTGWVVEPPLSVKLGTHYRVHVTIGAGRTSFNVTGGVTFEAGIAEKTVDVPLRPGEFNDHDKLVLNWASPPDAAAKVVEPGMTLPYAASVILSLSGLSTQLADDTTVSWISVNGVEAKELGIHTSRKYTFTASSPGTADIRLFLGSKRMVSPRDTEVTVSAFVFPPQPSSVEGAISVGMRRATSRFTEDVPLWISIRKGTEALGFDRYFDFMNWVFCNDPGSGRTDASARKLMGETAERRFLPFTDTDAYRSIKVATEAFVMANCGVFSDFGIGDADYVQGQISLPNQIPPETLSQLLTKDYLVSAPGVTEVLPYLAVIRRKLVDQRIKELGLADVMRATPPTAPSECYGILREKLTCPCLLELIWSYWQEEGMLVQTVNALTRRFQNMRSPSGNDPLANMEIDPLRSLNNVIWGYIQDEQHRLTVVRRNYEYDHHYGLRLAGKAVRDVRTADSRSKFLEAFHTLLSITSSFYKRDDDTTIVADGFPVLNGLKEAHLILTQGAHNQYGDLPSTARIEMLMQQWILSRPEFREFLPTRIMVAYPEPWMDRVDAMKKLQGWTDTSVLHFRNLAIFGEQVLLSIRYGDWSSVNDPVQGTNWARYWRPEIQGYMHAYRSATGVDLSVDVTNARIDATLPSMHLVQRLTEQLRHA